MADHAWGPVRAPELIRSTGGAGPADSHVGGLTLHAGLWYHQRKMTYRSRMRRPNGTVIAHAHREGLSWSGAHNRLQRELGRCVDCGHALELDPPPMRCRPCADRHNERVKARRRRLKAAGRCQRCGLRMGPHESRREPRHFCVPYERAKHRRYQR